MAVLRDFVVLQGDGFSMSNSGGGWQYARDFGVGNAEWFAEKEMLNYQPGEQLVRRRVWMRLLVAQSDFFRANDFLNHCFFGFKNRNRGTIKTGTIDFFNASWTSQSWTRSTLTLLDEEILIELSRGQSIRIPIKAAIIRKLAIGTSDYKKERNDSRCEIEIVPSLDCAGGLKLRPSYLLRCKDEDDRSDWICALGHQIVLLGGGGKGCYDECELLRLSMGPVMSGEMFIEVEINLQVQEAKLNALAEEKEAHDQAAARRKSRQSFRRGSTADGVLHKPLQGMSAQEAATKAAAELAEEMANDATSADASSSSNVATPQLLPPPPPSSAIIEHSWQLRRFLLFDEHLESHHCNEDVLAVNVHSSWKIPLADFSYFETSGDPMLIILESAERVLKLRCTSMASKIEWREALRRVLRARSLMSLQSTFDNGISGQNGSARFTYSEDLVLVVKRNHVPEKMTAKLKPTVMQAQVEAQRKDDKLKGVDVKNKIPLVTENEALRILKEREEENRLSSRLYKFFVQVGIIKPLSKAPPLLMTNALTIAMNRIGLKTSKLFDGSESWRVFWTLLLPCLISFLN